MKGFWLRPPLAYVLDTILTEGLILALCFLFLRYLGLTLAAAILLTGVVVGLTAYTALRHLVARLRKRELRLLPMAYGLKRCRELVTASEQEARAVLDALRQHQQRFSPAGTQIAYALLQTDLEEKIPLREVLAQAQRAAQKGDRKLILYCTGYFTPACEQVKEVQFIQVELIDVEKLAPLLFQYACETDPKGLNKYAAQAQEIIRKRKKKLNPGNLARPLRLALTGLLLAGMSLITPYPRWYLFCSVAALLSASLTAILRLRKRQAA